MSKLLKFNYFYIVRMFAAAGIVSVAALLAFGQAQNSSQTQDLQPNQTIEREITGKEIHRYKFDLKKDEFFQVHVEQKGDADVALKLIDAAGQKLATMNSFYSGPETLTFAALTAGTYILEVSDTSKFLKGNYTIERQMSRMATAQDRRRVEVERLFVEAKTLRDAYLDGSGEQIETVITKFQEALGGWQELKDLYMSELTATLIKQLQDRQRKAPAEVILKEGIKLTDQDTLESRQAAVSKFEKALNLFREIGDKDYEAFCLEQLARNYSALGEKEKALDCFNQALTLRKAAEDTYYEADIFVKMGEIYSDLGEKQKALDYFNQALTLDRTSEAKLYEHLLLRKIGKVYSELGEKQKALDFYNQLLALQQEEKDEGARAATFSSIGFVYVELGEQAKALSYYNQALLLMRAAADKEGEATILTNIGEVYDDLAEYQKALDFYNQSLPIQKAIGDKKGEAITLDSIGKVYEALGEKQKALDYFNQSLSLGNLPAIKNRINITSQHRQSLY